jgi:myosin I
MWNILIIMDYFPESDSTIVISGIISILDDECLRPGDASDASFLEKLVQGLDGHPHFKSHRRSDVRTQKVMGRDVSDYVKIAEKRS